MLEFSSVKIRLTDFRKKVDILKKNLNYNEKKIYLKYLKSKWNNPNIWNNPEQARKIGKEYSSVHYIVNILDQTIKGILEISDLLELATEANDEEILNEVITEFNILEKKLIELEFNHLFSNKYDIKDCYLDIQAGSGGTEAQDWASMLMRMYLRWAISRGFKTEIIDESEGEIAGIKSATIKVVGDYAYGWLRTETGVHRLVRKSPFDSNRRRHTSFSSTFVYPEIDNDIVVQINPADLRIDVYRASGAGGQHVNRTESAVRITHIPTGLVTQCQNDRSQHKNKDQAIKQIKSKLYELETQKKNTERKIIENKKSNISWSSQIRSYILDDSRIKDLRTGIETNNVQSVLDGNLDQFIKASLKLGYT